VHWFAPQKFAYFHIPKAAGTSLTNALAAVKTVSSAFSPNDRMSAETASLNASYDIVAGHLSLDDYSRHFPERDAFTVLRNPVERCLSWYWYCRNIVPDTVEAEDVASAKRLGPQDYFSQPRSVIFRTGINGQCRQLGGHLNHLDANDDQVFNRAKSLIESMTWVGFAETLNEDLVRFKRIRGFAKLPTVGGANAAPRDHRASESVIRLIEANNPADIELYAFARSVVGRASKRFFFL